MSLVVYPVTGGLNKARLLRSRPVSLDAFGFKDCESLLGLLLQGRGGRNDFDLPEALAMRHAPVKRRDKLPQVALYGRTVIVIRLGH